MRKIKTIVICGPTASGKTALTVQLADKFRGEIVSADSRQVYKYMDIGTGKDLEEYKRKNVPYHLIDIRYPNEEYNLMSFCRDAYNAIEDITNRNKLPFLTGGTVLYIHAVLLHYELPGTKPDMEERHRLKQKSVEELNRILEEFDPLFYKTFKDKRNINRLVRAIEIVKNKDIRNINHRFFIDPLILGVYYPREIIHRKIKERLEKRLRDGMIDEVKSLHEHHGVSWDKLHFFGLEYRYIASYLQNQISFEEMKETLLAKIRQFARRQDIWFRKMEREGLKIHWLKENKFYNAKKLIEQFLSDIPRKVV